MKIDAPPLPIVNDSSPVLVSNALEHEMPDCPMHGFPPPRDAPALNTFSEYKAARTTAIIRIAHPYVIRYSIALCALKWLFFICTPLFGHL